VPMSDQSLMAFVRAPYRINLSSNRISAKSTSTRARYLVSPWITDSTYRRDIDFPRICATSDVQPAPGRSRRSQPPPIMDNVFISSQWKFRRPC
jgi:hypothetical protein